MGKITIGIANEGIKNLDVEDLKSWKPTEVTKFKDVVYFKHEEIFYSMKREDYIKIFN